jgi:exopolysaccharide biosynthesis protein
MRISLLLLFSTIFSYAHAEEFSWHQVEKGYSVGRYSIGEKQYIFSSEVLILRFSPEYFKFNVVASKQFGAKRSDVKTLTEKSVGIAGINANFFDEFENALGIVVSNGITINRVHQGGTLLSGIFLTQDGIPKIIHKSAITQFQPEVAVQSGPRLIANAEVLKVKEPKVRSRRSGIAIMKNGDVLIYATLLRFPGASFEEIQKMLIELKVTDALNFDGGGSSQLYVQKNNAFAGEVLISGGDTIPVALVVKKR